MSAHLATAQPRPDALNEIEDRLDQAVADVTARLAVLQAALVEQTRRAEALEQELAISEAKLAVESMHAAGLQAQAAHLMALALGEDSALTGPLAQLYDTAFDARAAELGIEEPARFRAA